MGATIRCSLFLWTANFSLPFSLNVVPAPAFSAAFSRSFPFGKSWRSIPFRRLFSCQSENKKADTQTSKIGGVWLSLQNDVLCIGFEFQRWDCLFIQLLADSTKKHIGWRKDSAINVFLTFCSAIILAVIVVDAVRFHVSFLCRIFFENTRAVAVCL